MLAQRDHRGHTWTTDDRELPSPPAVLEDPDDRDPRDVLEEARTVAGPDGELVTDGGESTDERAHAARISEQLAMDDQHFDNGDSNSETTDCDIQVGDVCIDLAQGRPVHVINDTGLTAAEWSEKNDYELTENYGNGRLDSSAGDRVFDVVYCSNIKSKPSTEYAFPESRLARVETEAADGGRPVYDRIVGEVLEQLFEVALEEKSCLHEADLRLALKRIDVEPDVVDEAEELAEVEATIGGGE